MIRKSGHRFSEKIMLGNKAINDWNWNPAMSEAVVDDIVAVLPPLLQSLEALSFVARHLNPPDFDRVMKAAGTPDQVLQSVRERMTGWPAEFSGIRSSLENRKRRALAAFGGLRMVNDGHGDIVAVFKGASLRGAGAGGALPAGGNALAGEPVFVDAFAARRRRLAGAARSARQRQHRHHPRQ